MQHDEFKDRIQNDGFAKTMDYYNISYVITRADRPDYPMYANFFSDNSLDSIVHDRTRVILSRIYPNRSYYNDLSIRERIIRQNEIQKYFVLEKRIGDYRFFRIIEP
jgi:hypothetical protein